MRLYLDSCVLIYALDGAEQLRSHTLQQLERYADANWVISDLVRMECLVGPLRSADQIRLLAFRSFFSDCSVVPLHPEVMERAAELRAATRLQTADAIHLLPRCTGAVMRCSPMTALSSSPRRRSRCCDWNRISP
jgi:predicted nucleic acid-binding protein